jgi:hypothetical protein
MYLKKHLCAAFDPGARLSNKAMRRHSPSGIGRKRATLIGTLRTHYGLHFAAGIAESETFNDAPHMTWDHQRRSADGKGE